MNKSDANTREHAGTMKTLSIKDYLGGARRNVERTYYAKEKDTRTKK